MRKEIYKEEFFDGTSTIAKFEEDEMAKFFSQLERKNEGSYSILIERFKAMNGETHSIYMAFEQLEEIYLAAKAEKEARDAAI
ncbi:hypothetical protein COLU111180_12720 [Cohnella lubricantis]|uniref:Uncharacterized protein n=1 Tax=Cohnella lubricantis TaxID=2163172 RepID=A0A841T7D4_9BACL|nr:hypothetical protein [Cohnella lubricantis]MBB6677433.1 hypothetical protein [Cohnella lubricantis]MBP2117519.1 hypothetical protein [Cohnella lubricantis]